VIEKGKFLPYIFNS